jgi:hypothetical protein
MVSNAQSRYPQATVFVAVQMAPHSEFSPIGVFSSQQAAQAACEECHMLVYGGDLCWMISSQLVGMFATVYLVLNGTHKFGRFGDQEKVDIFPLPANFCVGQSVRAKSHIVRLTTGNLKNDLGMTVQVY